LNADFAETLRAEWAKRMSDPSAPRPHPAEKWEAKAFGEESVDIETGEIIDDQVVWEENGERPATAEDLAK
jgi:hypothetical protein